MNNKKGLLLIITGPYLSSLITSDLKEQASIWCFFSLSQFIILILSNNFYYDKDDTIMYDKQIESFKNY